MLVADLIMARLGGVRDRILKAITSVNETTTTETIVAGGHLQRIVELGHAHITHLKALLGHSLGGNDTGLGAAIRTQASHVRVHVTDVSARMNAHRTRVDAAATLATSIAHTATQISHLNTEAKTLALNARIEAAHAGHLGAAFAVIAGEMHRLSRAIDQANTRITDLGAELMHHLPQISAESVELEAVTNTFATGARDHIDRIEGLVQTLHGEIATALHDSDTVLATMVGESHSALSRLQFQDVCAQNLRAIDGWLSEAYVEVAGSLGSTAEVAPPEYTTLGTSGEDDASLLPPAGDVVLF